ncbi:uncharacterized protein C8Q71DRAFT_700219 [Rhodofomes roseus]|uniref:MYND-type domain-containing protein n=2 Tax=Rhodofomes roseus TaxID=34475 RepID=A0ABQ8KT07_9APHY|nr:uncharacterized protein C8Q71DRAFT_700219 [Rhodofomes roseus]KAH9841725.1 hypothetical protein C8Q71DRAFT_700219 [Rhodofomes roseus]
MADTSQCFYCRKEAMTKDFKRCSRCRGALYCNSECQKQDWASHKELCSDSDRWYDKYSGCRDGSMHEGKLELITWEYTDPESGDRMGWGNVLIEEADDLKRKFEVDCKGKKSLFFKKWPQGFRWTCCGMDGGVNYGCDHHGTGSKPCTCDFCRMGRPLPDSIYKEKTGPRMGLRLPRGPDPRSFNPVLAAQAAQGRSMFGLEM